MAMKVLEAAPTHYRVKLDSGHEMVIARTPGTQAIVFSQSPEQNLAGGGTVGEDQPFDPFGSMDPNLLTEQQRADMAIAAAGPSVRQPAVAAQPPAAPALPHERVKVGPSSPNWEDLAADLVAKYKPQAEPQLPVDRTTLRMAEGAAQPPAQPSPTPGAAKEAPSPNAPRNDLERAIATKAEHEAALQDKIAEARKWGTDANEMMGAAPQQERIDPGSFYAKVGQSLGAKTPHGARILGGIATGLITGIGELGAAMSHRQNEAASIITQSMDAYMRSEVANQALTRQQWLDQKDYLKNAVEAKILDLSESGKSQGIKDSANLMIQQLRAQYLQSLVKDNLLKPDQAELLASGQMAINSLNRTIASMPTPPAGLVGKVATVGAAKLDAWLGSNFSGYSSYLNQRDAAKMYLATLLNLKSNRAADSPAGLTASEGMMPGPADGPDDRASKLKAIEMLERDATRLFSTSAVGGNPMGGQQVTPTVIRRGAP